MLNKFIIVFQLTQDVTSIWNMDNFKFNFLSKNQPERLNLDKFFLPLIKILLCYEFYLQVTLSLPLYLECFAEINK